MAKQKLITPDQAEEIRTKDFFDLIAPPTIRFYSDYFITGDTYRCAWAVKEYPPSTDEASHIGWLFYTTGKLSNMKISEKTIFMFTASRSFR